MAKGWTLTQGVSVVFGEGSRYRAGEIAGKYGAKSILLLYDMAMEQFGYRSGIEESLKKTGLRYCMWQIEEGEPTAQKVDRVCEFTSDKNVDAIIAVGGGSTMDTAKLTGKILANGGRSMDYLNRADQDTKAFTLLITIPSTAGTGAEVTPYLTCSTEDGKKGGTGNTPVTCAIVDPEITYGLPSSVTANTGIDALCHAAEVLCNYTRIQNEYADTLCKEAVRMAFRWLPEAYKDGKNKEARHYMSYAALIAGMALPMRGTFIGHPIANQICNRYHIPHGAGCSIGMSVFAHYNTTEDPDWIKLQADLLGIDGSADDYSVISGRVAEAYDNISRICNMKTMKDLGADISLCDEITEDLKEDRNLALCPVPVDFEVLNRALKEVYEL